jgi:hypothetical protein
MITVKEYLKKLLGRKVIMLLFCSVLGAILFIVWQVDPWYIVGLYGAFVGGNGIEHATNRRPGSTIESD